MNTIHLDANMVPAVMRAGYNGKFFKARVCETMTIPADAGLWSGGSRETYRIIRLDDGATRSRAMAATEIEGRLIAMSGIHPAINDDARKLLK